MAKITGHVYSSCVATVNGIRMDSRVARIIYSDNEINPPSLAQRIKNSRSYFYSETYHIPEENCCSPVVGITRDIRFWPSRTYWLPDNLLFIPLGAFKECLDKKTGEFTMPKIYSSKLWRVENYRKITRTFYDYSYETSGGYWKSEKFGDKILMGMKLDGRYNTETNEIIKNEFYTIPHDENGVELAREWSTCFVRDDVKTLRLDIKDY